jgi:ParB family chromosome partitioning protein
MAKSGLGKGLGALISAAPSRPSLDPESGEKVQLINSPISPSPLQPRREFQREALEELVDSIRQRGIIQPLIVGSVNGRLSSSPANALARGQEVGLARRPPSLGKQPT